MAYVEGGFKTFQNGAADLADGVAVKLAAGKVVVATAATDVIIGVVHKGVKAGFPVSVRLRSAAGTSQGTAGGTIAAGDAVTANGTGVLITTTTAGNQIVGYALEAATTGKVFEFIQTTAKY